MAPGVYLHATHLHWRLGLVAYMQFVLKHVGFSVQRMVFAVEIARFGAILKREADHRDRTPLALSQFGCRHQAVASGEGSAHNLTPLVPTDGGVGREAGEQWPGGRWRTHVVQVPRSA